MTIATADQPVAWETIHRLPSKPEPFVGRTTVCNGAKPLSEEPLMGRHALLLILLISCLASLEARAVEAPPLRVVEQQLKEGNWADALKAARSRLDSKVGTPDDLSAAVQCLGRLARTDDYDSLLESVTHDYADNSPMLVRVARSYLQLPHYGYFLAGEFHRGQQRGGGTTYNCVERDRVQALRVLRIAEEVAEKPENRAQALELLAQALIHNKRGHHSWLLQKVTDLDLLPEPVEGWRPDYPTSPPPVDEAGEPVMYEIPTSWNTARNDGERWRWALDQRARATPTAAAQCELAYADFLHEQFGVHTAIHTPEQRWGGDDPRATLRSLRDDETIAKLAIGVKRIVLPEGHHWLEIYERHEQWKRLIDIRLDRQQRAMAAEAVTKTLRNEKNKDARERLQKQLDQILKPWVRFEMVKTQPAGEGPSLRIAHRNADEIQFSARLIDHRRLLADLIEWLRSNPKEIDHHRLQVEELGWRLLEEDKKKYLGDQVAQWRAATTAAEDHADTQETIVAPLQQPGAYLVTATPAGGEPFMVVLWVADTVLVEKPTDNGALYQMLDASQGSPIEGGTVELFGFRNQGNQHLPEGRVRRLGIETRRESEKTNAEGIAQFENTKDQGHRSYSWLATAHQGERFAYLGFSSMWRSRRNDSPNLDVKTYLVTDRPVYRPGDIVEFKAWVARPDYAVDPEIAESEFAHKSFTLELHDARGDKIWTQELTASSYGGLSGQIQLPEDASLGRYQLTINGYGGDDFRVEEYRKPEFEVTVEAPEKPVRLGEPFEAVVKADYYFGSPVTEARVKFTITRTRRTDFWFPVRPWDWLYGRGYGWLVADATWHSSWREWRCYCPPPSWWPQPQAPPEVVSEGQAEIGPDGVLRLPIETQPAFERWPDDDHTYTINAEVTDASRRTITGTGTVLAARREADVTLLLDRGHYDVGETVQATIHLRTPDGKPIAGDGVLRLLRIDPTVEGEETREVEVQTWDLATGAEGYAEMRLKASQPGRYRVVYESTAIPGAKVLGGVVFTILGPGFDGGGFRFAALEVVPDKSVYQPGETARLLLSTDRIGSVVMLYVRPINGLYTTPTIVRLDGQCEVVEIPINKSDQPNFFVEAITVAEGRVHTVAKQLVVPPTPRVVQVEAAASADAFLPGQEGTIKVRLTTTDGEPVIGEATVAVYDKSVEAIAPDILPGDIRERFWGWKRNHYPRSRHNLSRVGHGFTKPKRPSMQSLGRYQVAEPYDPIMDMSFGAPVDIHSNWSALRSRNSFFKSDRGRPAPEPTAMAMAGAGAAETASVEDAPQVRSNFADTALWVGSIKTDSEGFAELPLTMPESLTGWKIRVWAMGDGVRVGQGSAEVVTRKDLMVRLQAPRFLVETDEAILSAIVNNYLDAPQSVRVKLEVNGTGLSAPSMAEHTVEVEAGGETRVDWRVEALGEGVAELIASAIASPETGEQETTATDAMQIDLPVLIHGAERVESFSAVVGADERLATFELMVPPARRPEATRLEVQYSTTLAGAMLRPLPYLVEYPHGCTEQTLNRFLPAVIVQKTLLDLGVDFDNLPPGGAAQQAINGNPIGDADELRRIVKAGVRRLDEMQLTDGGWGWFSGYGERSTPHTTAVVVRGLILARDNNVAVPDGVIERGLAWLESWRDEQLRRLANVDANGGVVDSDRPYKRHADNADALIALVLAEGGRFNQTMRERLFADRLSLSPYCLATLGLTLHLEAEQAQENANKILGLRDRVIRNLIQFVVEDDENQTAYLDLPGGMWWRWYGSEFEAHAYFLKLLTATDPQGDLTAGVVKYLVNNRRNATRWNSTRDTALVIEALAEYARGSGETGEGEATEIEVWIDGQRRQQSTVAPAEALLFDGRFILTGEELASGRHTLELRKKGPSRLYVAAALTNFSLERDLRAAGLEVRVQRRVTKLEPIIAVADEVDQRGGALQMKTQQYRRIALPNLASVESGDLVEVELILTSKNDYEYLILEDPKPAGFEPIDTLSGYNRNDLGAYVEFRDERVCFYASRLMRGEHSVRYRLRAETPGAFAALPAQISAMYAPELRGNSDEIRLRIED